MNNLLKFFMICAITVVVACGGESKTDSISNKKNVVINKSMESSFEAKASSFFIDEIDDKTVRFSSMVLKEIRFNSEIEDIHRESLDLFIQSMLENEVFFKSTEEYSTSAGEGSDFKRISNGYLTIGEERYKAKCNYTNESSTDIQGVIIAEKPELLSFLPQDEIVIRVKGRQ